MVKYMNFTCQAISKSATIAYTVEICATSGDTCMKYEDKQKFDDLCRNGCPNYSHKWSCPPYAPPFERLASKWKNLYIVFIHADMEQFSYIKNDYLKVKAANSMLKSRADRFIREMARLHGEAVSTGSCRLCKPCRCKSGMPCAHPESMAYSFEALGIDVGRLTEDYFQRPLKWYSRQSLPEYTSVVCGILTNEDLSGEYLRAEYEQVEKSFGSYKRKVTVS